MALINFKERIHILLKLKESLIPQVDGNFVKDWETEAMNYQVTSENIIIHLKDIYFIEGLITPISAQLTFLRINLQNYVNMSEKEKDKFKRLYVLAALGLIAKLKLILFFSTYINARENNRNKNFPVFSENYYNLGQYNCERNYEDKLNLINNGCDQCVNNEDEKNSTSFNHVDDYYNHFNSCTDDYKEDVFNMMALNNIMNCNSHLGNDKNVNDSEYVDNSIGMYDNCVDMTTKRMNSNHVGMNNASGNHVGMNNASGNHVGMNNVSGNHVGMNNVSGNHVGMNNVSGNHVSDNRIGSNHHNRNNVMGNHVGAGQYNSLLHQSTEEYPSNLMTHFAMDKNEGLQNIPAATSKKRAAQMTQSQNKTANFLKNSHNLNGIKNGINERMQNYNEQINNETQRFLQQNQDQISKYLNNIHQNIHANNENGEFNSRKSNLSNYYDSDSSQANNILQSYTNKIYGLSDNVYKNSYFL
ncbi:conserved Plasmodium protein, unknown function [Plasmodium knowlesi strain H]|uniref:Uncharacterized protein n=3 Tax=Plasmodium knowlesi TaxID=5850 RepID=A0A5K1UFM0_PLAKH|nr:conserved protein, unknown function [Plasmodium knowlesi strain H]OTN66963.1 Uncharacterized protein PKNOH_S07445400 [Plasmodium knowlesi]CAA9988581.1 conserved protein, unknown function [Plasmodium knowlesi strain H]SBO21393.1 conserved Plasmodium protein, unknown function [Plasmodium knowlesi strain H]SBO21847.1 conserved Plasmodium protein, unknown function [Plasmodium knowlesi strain H]VVS78055.1 conserved protein, unknown function [Plasmodium knowlesi strain H]|eukprot:XP_002259557.1 hypothetical protein, conserved in Plasmodium species [Plasmodium knowlesi strain H]